MENMETGKSDFQVMLDTLEFPDELDARVAELLSKKNLTISVAESLTGGLISSRLTSQPGSSQFYIGGIVCYSPRIKVQQVGVPPRLISQKGIVSDAVAMALAQGVRMRMGTHVGVGVTGFAGPAVSETERVGLVYVAIATEETTKARQFLFEGNRDEIRQQASDAAMGLLYFMLKGEQ